MAYIGNTATTQSFTPAIDYFSGNGSTTAFTLSRPVASVAQVQVTINNVAQNPSSAYTVNGNTITFTSAPLSGTNNIYVYYTSPNTQVIAPSQGTVSVNSLDSTFLLTEADGGIGTTTGYYGFKNRIINGAMMVAQRGTTAVTTNDSFPVDRFKLSFANSTGAFSAQQTTTAPAGFINSTKYLTTTADASLGATEYAILAQPIEGLNVADLAWGTASAATVTLSFWCRSSTTGTFGGSLRNSAGDRSYPFTFTISVANTWEQKSITIAGDTTGTWLTTNGVGIYVTFAMGAGATLSGTAGAWAGVNYIGATGAVNLIATLNADFYITGVQLEKGSTATSFDYRPYGTELTLCQRYYESTFPIGTAPAQNAGESNALRLSQVAIAGNACRGNTWLFKTTKRATPGIITSYNPSAANANVRNSSRSNDAAISGIGGLNTMGISFTFVSSTSSVVGDDNAIAFSADAEL